MKSNIKIPFNSKETKIIWIIAIALVLAIIIWFIGKRNGKRDKGTQANLPNNGNGIPTGWSPKPDAVKLYNAMQSDWYNPFDWGTDEDAIFSVLESKTPDQVAAIYNEFNRLYYSEYGCDLICWLESELSSSDLSRAMSSFNGIAVL